jgi:3-oxoacyl-[acyl-carrier-protein] synthase II
MGSRAYTDIYVQAAEARCCLGDATSAWRAVVAGASGLRQHPRWGCCGWVDGPIDLMQLAMEAAGPAWTAIAREPGWTAVVAAASKGDTGAWIGETSLDPQGLLAGLPGSFPLRLAGRLGIGPHLPSAPVAACATGLYAILEAADHLAEGRCDRALAGAADRSLQPLLMAGFQALGVVSDGPPGAFDGQGGGFAPAEGAGFLALNRRPGPWRLVGGSRLGDASHETRCADPRALKRLLADLWTLLPEPDLIITHGTGTAAGDSFELAGLEAGPWRRAPRQHLKPALGHCLGASSAVELAVALQAPVGRLWKLALGFGGHLAAVALERR